MKTINYWVYYIDSTKFFIDADVFKSVSIPEHTTLIDSDSGDVIDDFKRKSINVPYKNHHVYIGKIQKQLPSKDGNGIRTIDKVCIFFPSKVCKDYFKGITKQDFYDVLDFLRSKGYLDFDSAHKVFANTYLKDTDITTNICVPKNERIDIREWFELLHDSLFNGVKSDCLLFPKKGSKSSKNGFGLQTYTRENNSITKPFIKFYDKSIEILIEKNKSLYEILPEEIKQELSSNFVLRFEITLKDIKFFQRYDISNRLEDVLLINQQRWQEIADQFMKYNFEPKLRPRDTSKMTPIELSLALKDEVMASYGATVNDIKATYVRSEDDKLTRFRMNRLFEKITAYRTKQQDDGSQLMSSFKRLIKFNKWFNL